MQIETDNRRYLEMVVKVAKRLQTALNEDTKAYERQKAIVATAGRPYGGDDRTSKTCTLLADLEDEKDESDRLFTAAAIELNSHGQSNPVLANNLITLRGSFGSFITAIDEAAQDFPHAEKYGGSISICRKNLANAVEAVGDLLPAVEEIVKPVDVNANEREASKKLEGQIASVANPREILNDQQDTSLTIDGKTYEIADKRAYRLFKLVADAKGEVVSKAIICRQINGLRGKNALTLLRKKLPKVLQKYLQSMKGKVGGLCFVVPKRKNKKSDIQ